MGFKSIVEKYDDCTLEWLIFLYAKGIMRRHDPQSVWAEISSMKWNAMTHSVDEFANEIRAKLETWNMLDPYDWETQLKGGDVFLQGIPLEMAKQIRKDLQDQEKLTALEHVVDAGRKYVALHQHSLRQASSRFDAISYDSEQRFTAGGGGQTGPNYEGNWKPPPQLKGTTMPPSSAGGRQSNMASIAAHINQESPRYVPEVDYSDEELIACASQPTRGDETLEGSSTEAAEATRSSEFAHIFHCCPLVGGGRQAMPILSAVIETVPGSVLVDTGSPRSAISVLALQELQRKLSREGCNRLKASTRRYVGIRCMDVQGNALPIQHCVTLTVRLGDEERILPFLVVQSEGMTTPILLGTDALAAFGATLQIGQRNTHISFSPTSTFMSSHFRSRGSTKKSVSVVGENSTLCAISCSPIDSTTGDPATGLETRPVVAVRQEQNWNKKRGEREAASTERQQDSSWQARSEIDPPRQQTSCGGGCKPSPHSPRRHSKSPARRRQSRRNTEISSRGSRHCKGTGSSQRNKDLKRRHISPSIQPSKLQKRNWQRRQQGDYRLTRADQEILEQLRLDRARLQLLEQTEQKRREENKRKEGQLASEIKDTSGPRVETISFRRQGLLPTPPSDHLAQGDLATVPIQLNNKRSSLQSNQEQAHMSHHQVQGQYQGRTIWNRNIAHHLLRQCQQNWRWPITAGEAWMLQEAGLWTLLSPSAKWNCRRSASFVTDGER